MCLRWSDTICVAALCHESVHTRVRINHTFGISDTYWPKHSWHDQNGHSWSSSHSACPDDLVIKHYIASAVCDEFPSHKLSLSSIDSHQMILLNTPVSVSVRYTESWELNRWPLDCWTTHRLASWLQYNYQLVSACCSEYLASLWLQSECQWDVTSRQSLQWEGDRPASDLHVIQPAPSKLHLQTSQTSKSLTSVETLLLEHFMTIQSTRLVTGRLSMHALVPTMRDALIY